MIPTFDKIRIPALKFLKTQGEVRFRDFKEPLGRYFNLTDDELKKEYPSGNGEIFLDRISWALSDLFTTSLVERPQRGVYLISTQGKEKLESCTDEELNEFIKQKLKEIRNNQETNTNTTDNQTIESSETPNESIENSYNYIKNSVTSEILATILSKKPHEFEHLVVKLLQKMGYGGEIKNSGITTQQSNDGGIDGIIKEDVLGFNHIFIQAKRYSINNKVQKPEVQSFVGAVAGTSSKKGVFITTSDFSRGALDYIASLNGSPTVILINGKQLTEYMYEYGLGLQTEKTLKIMKIDSDFWFEMDDDETELT
ncbi:restriction endonuclease [Ornithobacterium rhinotracheale]|uniref:restriction endonuclease n=1 Tax=Ornithobacterium rhinotracheale TaxID=28251 RepID=UPI001FF534A5|nr:restriction endonuclease [Ornithobacterium rhinotracheale]MCK0205685.1 restriction endonuclease [Ornithobacterium rhinotracheale]